MFYWLLAVLATFRLTYLVVYEDGPFGLVTKARSAVYNRKSPEWLRVGLACPFCVSFWLAWAAGLLLAWGTWQEYVLLALATAGAAMFLFKVFD